MNSAIKLEIEAIREQGRTGRLSEKKKFVRAWIHLHFLVFLPTDLYFQQFVDRCGQIVPGPKNIASPSLSGKKKHHYVYESVSKISTYECYSIW